MEAVEKEDRRGLRGLVLRGSEGVSVYSGEKKKIKSKGLEGVISIRAAGRLLNREIFYS